MLQRTLEALCDPTRREIMKLLRKNPKSSGEIAEKFDISAPAISRHLSVLREAELVIAHREGKSVIYSLSPESLELVADWLDDFLKEIYG